LGDGTTTNKLSPVAVDTTGKLANKNISKISLGFSSSCVLTEDSILACFGSNGFFLKKHYFFF
jgi:hypothetical protein